MQSYKIYKFEKPIRKIETNLCKFVLFYRQNNSFKLLYKYAYQRGGKK